MVNVALIAADVEGGGSIRAAIALINAALGVVAVIP